MQRDHVNWANEDGVAILEISNGPLNVLSSSVKRGCRLVSDISELLAQAAGV